MKTAKISSDNKKEQIINQVNFLVEKVKSNWEEKDSKISKSVLENISQFNSDEEEITNILENEKNLKFKIYYDSLKAFRSLMNSSIDENTKILCQELSEKKATNDQLLAIKEELLSKIVVLDYLIERNNTGQERFVFDGIIKYLKEKVESRKRNFDEFSSQSYE